MTEYWMDIWSHLKSTTGVLVPQAICVPLIITAKQMSHFFLLSKTKVIWLLAENNRLDWSIKKSIWFSCYSIHHGDKIAYIIGNDIQEVSALDTKQTMIPILKRKTKVYPKASYTHNGETYCNSCEKLVVFLNDELMSLLLLIISELITSN